MKLSPDAVAALQQPDTKSLMVEMTPEVRERLNKAADSVVDCLMVSTRGPMEAYMVLQFVREAFEEKFGIRAGIIVGSEVKH